MDAVERIKKITKETEVMHKNALAEGRTEECIKIIEKIEAMSSEVLKEVSDTRRVLVELADFKKSGAEEAKVRSVGRSFLQAMKEFEGTQETYKAKYRKQLERQYKLVYPDGGVDLGLMTDSQTSLLLTQQIFRLSEDSRARKELESMRARNSEMQELEKGVEEVRLMFEQISMLVSQQGDAIDKVEDYVIEIQGNVKDTVTVLDQSVEKHRARQRRRRILFLVMLMVLMVLLGIILNEIFPSLIPGIFNIIFGSGFKNGA